MSNDVDGLLSIVGPQAFKEERIPEGGVVQLCCEPPSRRPNDAALASTDNDSDVLLRIGVRSLDTVGDRTISLCLPVQVFAWEETGWNPSSDSRRCSS